MIVKEQKPIQFINKCDCIVNERLLEKAIIWYSDKPVTRLKSIYMYGRYPSVTIYKKKLHIHRLLMMYKLQRQLKSNEYIHHINGNVLNCMTHNLILIDSSEHQRMHNVGRKQTDEHIRKRINATTKTRYGHSIYENKELIEKWT